MSIMIEVHYQKPESREYEQVISVCASEYDGAITYRENNNEKSICLTIEFPSWKNALDASSKLREAGEYVEGPMDYGGD